MCLGRIPPKGQLRRLSRFPRFLLYTDLRVLALVLITGFLAFLDRIFPPLPTPHAPALFFENLSEAFYFYCTLKYQSILLPSFSSLHSFSIFPESIPPPPPCSGVCVSVSWVGAITSSQPSLPCGQGAERVPLRQPGLWGKWLKVGSGNTIPTPKSRCAVSGSFHP